MGTYNFDVKLTAGPFTIEVDTVAEYGYFEHETLGDTCGGGLWFQGNKLTDYDGVFELPRAVAEGLRAAGFIVDPEFD